MGFGRRTLKFRTFFLVYGRCKAVETIHKPRLSPFDIYQVAAGADSWLGWVSNVTQMEQRLGPGLALF